MRKNNYSIRNLQSRDKLTLAVVVKDPSTGKSRTVTLELLGPCVIWESTTQDTINSENASRCFEIWLDETENQTRRIHAAQRLEFTPQGWNHHQDKAAIIRKHQNAQRLLRPLKVHIPFIKKLCFPSGWMRTRRDNRRFLSLIANTALLNQYQREIKKTEDGVEYVIATVEDYREAYGLAKGVLSSTLSYIRKDSKDLLNELFKMVDTEAEKSGVEPGAYQFTRRQVRERTRWSEPKVRRTLRGLVDMEYLESVSRGKGRDGYKYTLSVTPGELGSYIDDLTTPSELEKNLNKSSKPS